MAPNAKRTKRHNPHEPISSNWLKMSTDDYVAARDIFNPYAYDPTSNDERFYCKMHMAMYHFVIGKAQSPVIPQQWFNVAALKKDYPQAIQLCEFHDLIKLMKLRKNYSEELIKEFFSTVYFHKDVARTMTWMSAGQRCTRTLAQFGQLLGYEVHDPEDHRYRRIHDRDVLHCNPYLHHAYPEGDGPKYAPAIVQMSREYHLLNKIFRNTLAIKSGDKGHVRGYLVNTLYYVDNRSKKIDIMDYMYEEMRRVILNPKKCCIYAPYIQILIEDAIGQTFANNYETTPHKPLRVARDLAPGSKKRSNSKRRAVPGVEDEAYVHKTIPYRASKATWKDKLKQVFCLNLDIQEQNYMNHVSNKTIRSNQKKIMRHHNIPCPSGSEDRVTPREEWISKHSTWVDDDDDATSSRPSGRRALDESEEEDEEEEFEDEESEEEDDDMDEDDDGGDDE